MERKQFKTEVSELLHLIIHSLYSHKEIFLRELVSNASDALDKLKYRTLVDGKTPDGELRIDISFTEGDKRTLTIADNGIGMSHDELNDNLGTIARSGTRTFLQNLTDEQKKDSNLIGQFGVGFYSAFMVADKVEVTSRAYGETQAWKWVSDGKDKYTLEEAERSGCGTTIVLYLNDEGKEYGNRWQIENLIKQYSDHIAYPIYLAYDQNTYDDKYNVTGTEHKVEKINSAAALWTRSKSELKEEDYNSFYKDTCHDSEDPLFYLPPVAVFLALVVQIQHNCGAASGALCFLDGVLILSVADPFPGLLLTIGFGRDLHLVGHHECRVETHTELSDQVAVLLLFVRKILQEGSGSRAGNRAQVVVQLVMSHTYAVIADCQSAVLTLGEADVYAKLAIGSLAVHQRAVLELIQRVRCIGHQFAQEYFLM